MSYWQRFSWALQINRWPVSLSEGVSIATRKAIAQSLPLFSGAILPPRNYRD
jgi:hypothetical protein